MSLISVLTVDDEPHIHAGLDAIVDWQALGFNHIASALSAGEALAAVEAHHPEVVITDIRMPEVDGLELVKRLRRLPGYEPWIVVLSGYGDFRYAQEALRLEVHDYLLKPVDELELREVLRRIGRGAGESQEEATAHHAAVRALVKRAATERADADLAADLATLLRDVPDSDGSATIDASGGFSTCIAIALTDRDKERLLDVCASLAVAGTSWVIDEVSGAVAFLVEARGDVRLQGKALRKACAESVGGPVFLGIGPAVEGIHRSYGSTRSLVRSLERGHAVGEAVHCAGPDTFDGEWTMASPRWTELLDAVDRLDEPAALSVIAGAFAEIERSGASSVALADLLHGVAGEATRLIDELRLSPPEAIPELRRTAGSICFLPRNELRRRVEVAVSAVVRLLASGRKVNAHSAVSLVVSRLMRRPAEANSLQTLANEFHMSPVYLGKLFRQVTGFSFRDYQRRCRVRDACRSLRESDLTVPEIAENVGFRDADYFTSVFKDLVGVTPQGFRQGSGPAPDLLNP